MTTASHGRPGAAEMLRDLAQYLADPAEDAVTIGRRLLDAASTPELSSDHRARLQQLADLAELVAAGIEQLRGELAG